MVYVVGANVLTLLMWILNGVVSLAIFFNSGTNSSTFSSSIWNASFNVTCGGIKSYSGSYRFLYELASSCIVFDGKYAILYFMIILLLLYYLFFIMIHSKFFHTCPRFNSLSPIITNFSLLLGIIFVFYKKSSEHCL